MDNSFMRTVKMVFGFGTVGFGILLILSVFFGSWYTISEQERGIILRNGAYARTVEPGLGFKIPIIDSLVTYDLKEITAKWPAGSMQTYSKDLQVGDVQAAVTYYIKPDQVEAIYRRYGTVENIFLRIIQPRTEAIFKNVFGTFTAYSAVQDRPILNQKFQEAIQAALKDEPFVIKTAQITDVSFSKAFDQSIDDRMKAEVEVARLKQNWEREKVQADIVRTQASAKADAVRFEAQAAADSTKLRGEADAFAIAVKAKALADSPNLIALTQAERWNGKLPDTMVPGSALPMLSLNNNSGIGVTGTIAK